MRFKAILALVALLAIILAVMIVLSNTSPRNVEEEVHGFDSLVYPNNTTTIELTECHVLVNETKPKPRIETQTVMVTAVVNEGIAGTATVANKPVDTVSQVYGATDRPLPIIEYECNGRLLVVEFTKLKQVNVSKILLRIEEYTAPVPGNVIKHFSEEGVNVYVELVNGSKKPMEKTLVYSVDVDQGGYIVLEKNNKSIVKLKLALEYTDGFIKQYGIEILRVKIKQVCLDNNCTITLKPRAK